MNETAPAARSTPEQAATEAARWSRKMAEPAAAYLVIAADEARTRAGHVTVLLGERVRLQEELLRARIQHALTASGISLAEIAAETQGLDPEQLNDAMRGTRRFRPLELAQIADACGTTVASLLRGTEPEPEAPRPMDCTVCEPGAQDETVQAHDARRGDGVTVLPGDAFDALLEEAEPTPNAATRAAVGRYRQLFRQHNSDAPRRPEGAPE